MHHKDLQFKHELKKKEREINKLKDRLHQMLMDKNPDRKVGESDRDACCRGFCHEFYALPLLVTVPQASNLTTVLRC